MSDDSRIAGAHGGGETVYDLCVIGGGINGCGIARDAVGRGAKVILFEKNDLAGATSSASTKLIHGGLRYLEQYEFRLVREALNERKVLSALAPHLIKPLRFVLPHHAGLRPRWMLRAGLFIYDHLGDRGGLPAAAALDLQRDAAGAPLREAYRRGFEYSDCWVDDARLVVLNALDAHERGARIRTRTDVVSAARDGKLWRIDWRDQAGASGQILAKALVNAAGPWVNEVAHLCGIEPAYGVRWVKGSHIITRALFDHDRAYIFQNADGRVIFAIPYQHKYTLIGTTDVDVASLAEEGGISADEIAYLCEAVSEYFRQPITPADVVSSYAGVRPLPDDGSTKAQEATRDYTLALDAPAGAAPVLTLYGGKITTYRRLAEAVLDKLPGLWGEPWTATGSLPGGDLSKPMVVYGVELASRFPNIAPATVDRLAHAYGSRAEGLLRTLEANGPGEVFTQDLTQAEVEYLMAIEWACTAEDVLWRRTKLGLGATSAEAARLQQFMQTEAPRTAKTGCRWF